MITRFAELTGFAVKKLQKWDEQILARSGLGLKRPIQPDQGAVARPVVLLWFSVGRVCQRGVLSPALCAYSALRHRRDGVAGSAGWRPRLAA